MKKLLLAVCVSTMVGCGGGSGSSSDTSSPETGTKPEAFTITLSETQFRMVPEMPEIEDEFIVNGDMSLDHEVDNMHPVISDADYTVTDLAKFGDYAIIVARSDHPMTEANSKYQVFITGGDGKRYANIASSPEPILANQYEAVVSFPNTAHNDTNHTMVINSSDGFVVNRYDENFWIVDSARLPDTHIEQPLYTKHGIISKKYVDNFHTDNDYTFTKYNGTVVSEFNLGSAALPIGVSTDGKYAVFHDINHEDGEAVFAIDVNGNKNVWRMYTGNFVTTEQRTNVGDYVFVWNNIVDLGADFSSEANDIFHMTNVCFVQEEGINYLKYAYASGGKFVCANWYDYQDNLEGNTSYFGSFEVVDIATKTTEFVPLDLPAVVTYTTQRTMSLTFENGSNGLFDPSTKETLIIDNDFEIIK